MPYDHVRPAIRSKRGGRRKPRGGGYRLACFLVLAIALLLALTGCAAGELVAATRDFHDDVAPKYDALVDGARRATSTTACEHCKQVPTEPWFTEDDRAREKRTFPALDFMLRRFEGK